MERLYRDDDWETVASEENGYLSLGGHKVPFVVFPNEDDVTTGKPDQLADRLETVFNQLWKLYKK